MKREGMIDIREKANRTLHELLETAKDAHNNSQRNDSTADMALKPSEQEHT
jgi:hypothetical protein